MELITSSQYSWRWLISWRIQKPWCSPIRQIARLWRPFRWRIGGSRVSTTRARVSVESKESWCFNELPKLVLYQSWWKFHRASELKWRKFLIRCTLLLMIDFCFHDQWHRQKLSRGGAHGKRWDKLRNNWLKKNKACTWNLKKPPWIVIFI